MFWGGGAGETGTRGIKAGKNALGTGENSRLQSTLDPSGLSGLEPQGYALVVSTWARQSHCS